MPNHGVEQREFWKLTLKIRTQRSHDDTLRDIPNDQIYILFISQFKEGFYSVVIEVRERAIIDINKN